jgi:hypothetical protein
VAGGEVTARCDYSDLPTGQCAHCRGHVTTRTRAAESPSRQIEARYRGQCASCGEPYTVGALIEHDPTTGGWLAECCATDGEVDW